VERLRVLRTLEKHNMGGKTKFSEAWVDDIWRDLEKNGLLHYLQLGERQHGTEKVKEEMYLAHRRIDHISHFILRLAYCRTEELRRWFVTHETDLFRLRWAVLTETKKGDTKLSSAADHIGEFMDFNYDFSDPANVIPLSTKYQPISNELKESLEVDLRACTGGSLLDVAFYRVPWQEAVDLVRPRQCHSTLHQVSADLQRAERKSRSRPPSLHWWFSTRRRVLQGSLARGSGPSSDQKGFGPCWLGLHPPA